MFIQILACTTYVYGQERCHMTINPCKRAARAFTIDTSCLITFDLLGEQIRVKWQTLLLDKPSLSLAGKLIFQQTVVQVFTKNGFQPPGYHK